MAIGKKQDIGDIIRDAISAVGKPKRRAVGKQYRKGQKPPKDGPSVQGKRTGPEQKFKTMPRRNDDKPFNREEAILPRRPKLKNPSAPSRRQMPKRKPKAGPPRRMGNY